MNTTNNTLTPSTGGIQWMTAMNEYNQLHIDSVYWSDIVDDCNE